jgi:hypothetical protein
MIIKEGIYYCNGTNQIYEAEFIHNWLLFISDLSGTMHMNAEFLNNPKNGWIYLGEI